MRYWCLLLSKNILEKNKLAKKYTETNAIEMQLSLRQHHEQALKIVPVHFVRLFENVLSLFMINFVALHSRSTIFKNYNTSFLGKDISYK